MPQAISYHLLEEDRPLYFLVAEDHQPREARYRTVWDDGTETETLHVLYVEDGEVRSMLASEWTGGAL